MGAVGLEGDATPAGSLLELDGAAGDAGKPRVEALDVEPATGKGGVQPLGGTLVRELEAVRRAPGDHAGAGADPGRKGGKDLLKRPGPDEVLVADAGEVVDEAAHALGQRWLDQLAELADDPTLWRDLDRPDLDDLIREPLRATGVTGGRELKVKDDIACVGAAVV